MVAFGRPSTSGVPLAFNLAQIPNQYNSHQLLLLFYCKTKTIWAKSEGAGHVLPKLFEELAELYETPCDYMIITMMEFIVKSYGLQNFEKLARKCH
jgi:hypothetical protein